MARMDCPSTKYSWRISRLAGSSFAARNISAKDSRPVAVSDAPWMAGAKMMFLGSDGTGTIIGLENSLAISLRMIPLDHETTQEIRVIFDLRRICAVVWAKSEGLILPWYRFGRILLAA